jgi:hypothetical protein
VGAILVIASGPNKRSKTLRQLVSKQVQQVGRISGFRQANTQAERDQLMAIADLGVNETVKSNVETVLPLAEARKAEV